jgi:hypothetical protein
MGGRTPREKASGEANFPFPRSTKDTRTSSVSLLEHKLSVMKAGKETLVLNVILSSPEWSEGPLVAETEKRRSRFCEANSAYFGY